MKGIKNNHELVFMVTYLNSKDAIIRIMSFPNIRNLKYKIGTNNILFSLEEFKVFLSSARFIKGDIVHILVLNEKTGRKIILKKDFSINWPVDYDDKTIDRTESFNIPQSME